MALEAGKMKDENGNQNNENNNANSVAAGRVEAVRKKDKDGTRTGQENT